MAERKPFVKMVGSVKNPGEMLSGSWSSCAATESATAASTAATDAALTRISERLLRKRGGRGRGRLDHKKLLRLIHSQERARKRRLAQDLMLTVKGCVWERYEKVAALMCERGFPMGAEAVKKIISSKE